MKYDQRCRKYIEPEVQGVLARRLVWQWATFLVVGGIVGFSIQIILDPLAPLTDNLRSVWSNQGPFFVVAVLLIPFFVGDSIRLSHRFVGPVVRLRSEMRRLIDSTDVSEAPEMGLRPDDLWQGLADDYNRIRERCLKLQNNQVSRTKEELVSN